MKSNSKLFAAVAVLALVACAFAIAMPSEADAADIQTPATATQWTETGLPTTAGTYYLNADVTLTEATTIPAGVTIYTAGKAITTDATNTLTVAGTLILNGAVTQDLQYTTTTGNGAIQIGESAIVQFDGINPTFSSSASKIEAITTDASTTTYGVLVLTNLDADGYDITVQSGKLTLAASYAVTKDITVNEGAVLDVANAITMNGGSIINHGEVVLGAAVTGGAMTDDTIVSIAVTTNPTKMSYAQTEAFDPTGMVVTVTYDDDTTAVADLEYCYYSYDFSTVGDSVSVTIGYMGITTTLAVTVTEDASGTAQNVTGEAPVYPVVIENSALVTVNAAQTQTVTIDNSGEDAQIVITKDVTDADNLVINGDAQIDDQRAPIGDPDTNTFYWMDDGEEVTYNGKTYTIYHFEFAGKTYQYGVYVQPIDYAETITIAELRLTWMPFNYTDTEGNDIIMAFNPSMNTAWYSQDLGDYRSPLKDPQAGWNEQVIMFSGNVYLDGSSQPVVFNKILDLYIYPIDLVIDITMDSWEEGEEPSEMTYTVTPEDSQTPLVKDQDYTEVSVGYFRDAECEDEIDDLAELPYGTYYVRVEVSPVADCYEDPAIQVSTFTVKVHLEDSLVKFYAYNDKTKPLSAALVTELLGKVNVNDFQKNVSFANLNDGEIVDDVDGNGSVTGSVTGFLTKVPVAGELGTTLSGLFASVTGNTIIPSTATVEADGYYLAFYAEGDTVDEIDLKDFGTAAFDEDFGGSNAETTVVRAIVELTATENGDDNQRYFVAYFSTLQADSLGDGDAVNGYDTIGFTADADAAAAAVNEYNTMTYTMDFSYLNMYIIIFNDDLIVDEEIKEENYYNDEIYRYRLNGKEVSIISGAGDNFSHWVVEMTGADGKVVYRQFEKYASMIVGEKYDTDSDGVINLYPVYGAAAGSGDDTETDTPTQASSDIAVGVYYNNGRLVITLTALDGGYIPAGTITISGSYMTSTTIPGVGTIWGSSNIPATQITVEQGQTYAILNAEDGYSWIGTMVGLDVAYAAGEMTVNANHMTFTFVAPPTEA